MSNTGVSVTADVDKYLQYSNPIKATPCDDVKIKEEKRFFKVKNEGRVSDATLIPPVDYSSFVFGPVTGPTCDLEIMLMDRGR